MKMAEYRAPLIKAKNALQKYYRENHLDPAIDYSKDPIHGDKVKNLLLILNKERDKLERKLPLINIKQLNKRRIMKKKANEAKTSKKEKKAAINEVKTKKEKKAASKEAPKEKKAPRAMKYDYPLIDGREMNSIEKKKYRMEQRKLKNGGPKSDKDSKDSKKSSKKKEAPVETKKKDSKKKKTHKEED